MAPKAKAVPKAKKKPVAKTASKQGAKLKGLQLSTAQWKAYNKAYSAFSSAAYQRIALAAATRRFRKYRLAAAYATVKKYNIAHQNAQAAAIAAYAARESWIQSKLARQNVALRNRIEQNMYHHATLSGRMQYIAAGERAYAHQAVMRTVDVAQARSHEAALFAAAARIARKAKKSTGKTKGRKSSVSAKVKAQIATGSNQAGLRAVAALKHSTTLSKGRTSPKPTSAHKSKKAARKTKKGGLHTQKAVKKSIIRGHKAAAKSKKAPIKTAKGRAAPRYDIRTQDRCLDHGLYWIKGGNDELPTCVMTAIANAMLDQTGWRLPDADIAYWSGRCGTNPSIMTALHLLHCANPWPQVRLEQPFRINPDFLLMFPQTIIGYETENGPHAAYIRADGACVSWGKFTERPPAAEIEEAWTCTFKLQGNFQTSPEDQWPVLTRHA